MNEPPLIDALRAGLAQHRDALLQAPTGAGKSTLVPLALLRASAGGGRILMLEPRRLAARAVAARMAASLGERVGATVGYRMRLDTRVSSATRIEVITEGVLTQMLQEDPALEGVAWLLFDEYHERSLQADTGLALALDARAQLGAGFRILIMSATLEVERVAALLDDAAVVRTTGRPFAVDIRYLGRGPPLLPAAAGAGVRHEAAPQAAARAAARAVLRALDETDGDVLVFLAGAAEIRGVQAAFAALGVPAHVQVLALHGEMSAQTQDAVLSPAIPPTRKVVLSTNVAETSLTIPGVRAVVDSGLVRRPRFDPGSGMGRLELTYISRASSDQRAGRAGRTAPGVCYRLWSEGAQASLPAVTPAEILDADLAPLALTLARWGVRQADTLSWLDPPPPAALAQARELLAELEALDAQGRLTAHGRQMAQLPVHPRLSHMLLGARPGRAAELAARLAALLSDRDLLRERDPDVRTRVELLERADRPAHVERAAQAARRLQGLAAAPAGAARSLPGVGAAAAGLDAPSAGALLALAFPDRIGQRRSGAPGRYLLANGRGAAFVVPTSLAREPWIVAIQLDDREREARIELAAPLSLPELEQTMGARVLTEESFGWDERAGALQTRRVRRLGALILEERLCAAAPEDARTIPAMISAVRALGATALPWDEPSRSLVARMQLVGSLGRAELAGWPASDDAALLATLEAWLTPWLGGVTRRAQLAKLPLREALLARLTPSQRRWLDTLAPRELPLPSGAVHRIDYLGSQAPSLAVRLQEVFGLAEVPRIAGGAIPVTLQLLSPAQRPVQITRDLAGFWRGSYAAVRKDLRGRYPKHDWPEDPLTAVPSRRARRPTPGPSERHRR